MRYAIPLLVLLALATPLAAEPPAPPAAPATPAVPALATDAEAAAALATFEEAFKAKGLKGEVKLAAQEQALWALAKVQHASVVERLVKVARGGSVELRTMAVSYLGEQKALPGLAGPEIVAAMQKHATDPVLVMSGIQALADVGYRGVVEVLRGFFTHKDEFVKKAALLAVGDLKEMRLLEEILKLIKELKLDKGVKWEGGEVRYDSGAAGDADQKKAEQMYAEKYGQNAGRGKGAARTQRDIGPIIFETLKRLTEQEFSSGDAARAWAETNKAAIDAARERLSAEEKAQRAGAEESASR